MREVELAGRSGGVATFFTHRCTCLLVYDPAKCRARPKPPDFDERKAMREYDDLSYGDEEPER